MASMVLFSFWWLLSHWRTCGTSSVDAELPGAAAGIADGENRLPMTFPRAHLGQTLE
jgi:hypothetical protein